LLLGIAFLPGPWAVLGWIAFVPLLEALARRVRSGGRAFGLGYLFGLAFYLVGIHWIALLSDVAITVPWLKYPAWLAAAAYLALFPGLAAAVSVWLARRTGAGIAFVFPCVYLAVEELRASGELGFPWFQPGYTQHGFVPVLQLASLGSVTLVTLWLLVVNALLWTAWRGPARMRAALGAALVFALPWLWGLRVLAAAPPSNGPAVALVQGNIPGAMKWSGRHQVEIFETYATLTARGAADSSKPVIAIWPETATGTYLRMDPVWSRAMMQLATAIAIPVFAGYPDYEYLPTDAVRYYNAAGTFGGGAADTLRYAKRHLVPFGERMPFQDWIPGMGRIRLGQAEWTPGRDAVLIPSEAGPFAALICFESIFPDLARNDVRAGARWLVNVTNDEWFGNSAALYQHAAMAVFRAAENRVPLARCANTGLTMLVDAHGRIQWRLPVFAPGVRVGRLATAGAPTPYSRFGDWPGALAWLAVGVLGLVALRRMRAR
jgi:apolipoprotein N-acyltransferase